MREKVPDKSIFDEVAIEIGTEPAFVEKDWYVTQLIGHLSKFSYEGVQLVFSGGTALSKAHHLIERFSEDVDFRVIWPGLENENKTRQRAKLSELKGAIFEHIHTVFPINPDKIVARNANRFFAIDLDFPTVYERSAALRPHIQVEFTVTEMALDPLKCSVSSLVNELSGKPGEVNEISCIDPVENAVDKLSAFLWRTAERDRDDPNDDRSIVRHQHDLSILHDKAIQHPAFAELARKVIAQDNDRSDKIAGMHLSEKIEYVLNLVETDPLYKEEYERFVKSMSYAPNAKMPTYEESFEKVRALLHIIQEG